MEVKLWVPNFLTVNPDFKITWSGPAMPPGTLLYPYQSPVLQVINLSTFEILGTYMGRKVRPKNYPQKKALKK